MEDFNRLGHNIMRDAPWFHRKNSLKKDAKIIVSIVRGNRFKNYSHDNNSQKDGWLFVKELNTGGRNTEKTEEEILRRKGGRRRRSSCGGLNGEVCLLAR